MAGSGISRRSVVRGGAGAGLLPGLLAATGCTREDGGAGSMSPGPASGSDGHAVGRLAYRRGGAQGSSPSGGRRTGSFELDLGRGRPAAVHVPPGPGPLRLVVLLHGAGGEPARTRGLLLPYADRHRLLVAAPASSGPTWDVIRGGFGPDVRTVDELLSRLTAGHEVTGRTVAGFSDGASYALTLGIGNGDVFDSVVAFSPGFQAARVQHGRARFFVSHGIDDRVLPIDRCSRRLVPALERQGYHVTYEEFAGGHEVPVAVRDQAVAWLEEGDRG